MNTYVVRRTGELAFLSCCYVSATSLCPLALMNHSLVRIIIPISQLEKLRFQNQEAALSESFQ